MSYEYSYFKPPRILSFMTFSFAPPIFFKTFLGFPTLVKVGSRDLTSFNQLYGTRETVKQIDNTAIS